MDSPFVPVKVLNELRRQACLQLENAILALNENRHTRKIKQIWNSL